MGLTILFLLALVVDLSVSLDTALDPSGWNSYFTTEHSENIDAVDVVDPSGWNYNRGTKGFERNNDIKIDQAQQVLTFCQRVVEQRGSETNPLIEDVIGTAVKAKVAKIFNNKENINGNLAFIRRFISIILNTADLPNKLVEGGSDIEVSGVIEMRVSSEHLKILTDFINSKANVSMRELDSILTTSVHKKHISTFSVFELMENFFFFIRQKEIYLPVVLGFIVLFVSRLLLTSTTNTRLCISIVIFILTCSYVVKYYNLYKEAEINQKITLDKYSEIPSACDPRNQHWFSTLFKTLGVVKDEKQECVEYYKALSLDPLVEVSPSHVLSLILTDFVLYPFSKLGVTIAAFTSGILDGLPFYYGWIVWLGSSVGIFFLIALALLIVLGGRINLFGPFCGVSVSSHRPPEISPAAPTVSATPVTHSTSQSLLETVSEMSNVVVMNADALGALILRAQTSIATVHSGVQELNRPPKKSVPSKPSNEKSDTPQQKFTEKEESDLKTSTDKQIRNEDIASVVEKNCELKSVDNEQVEVYDTIEIIKSDFASGVLEDTTESKSGCVNIEKHPENVKKDN
ncbi:hypothetical protein R5R35_014635 [Gryllus longicercus]|uniref:Chloride channel CLIC-like protein 1 n=1 Tax=Gryllus longicercus TaxID=2509291 RepID=A0AAN9VMH9_9ORTH